MKKCLTLLFCVFTFSQVLLAQDKDEDLGPRNGFHKENLFTGGSIVLSFYNGGFLAGANPVFGCSLTKWVDVGIVGNYTYSSYRDYSYYGSDDKLHQSIYGGGLFTRLFPVRFLFAQAQVEHNWLHSKYIPTPGSGAITQTTTESANSILVGAGYTTGRDPLGKSAYGYLAILFDVGTDPLSPYKDAYNRAIPIFRAGFNVPLFQDKHGHRR
ncbi:MAG: hypothetical protein ACXVLT_05870 [Flavisolibacter sp.]